MKLCVSIMTHLLDKATQSARVTSASPPAIDLNNCRQSLIKDTRKAKPSKHTTLIQRLFDVYNVQTTSKQRQVLK